MVARLFTLLALLCHFAASAQTVGLHLVSAHQHGGLNGINPGIYVRFDNGATFGTYRNSHRRQSSYAAWTFETEAVAGFSAALTVGAITGYPAAEVMPMLAPSVAYRVSDYAARLAIVPRPPLAGASAALHLMFETHF
jgi:hypothetical protein